jgi:hypothetical protein
VVTPVAVVEKKVITITMVTPWNCAIGCREDGQAKKLYCRPHKNFSEWTGTLSSYYEVATCFHEIAAKIGLNVERTMDRFYYMLK